ncbi:MAG: iron-sulfur cluster assembly scaffold protein [Rubrobacteraceae bacterium]
MDRQQQLALLVDHAKNPRHREAMQDADVAMPGGSPECGGSVGMYLKGEGDSRIEAVSFTGQGDTISMAATSLLMEFVYDEDLKMDEVLALDYDDFVGRVGREVVGSRTRNATLGLSALKSVVRKYRKDRQLSRASTG